MEKHLEDLKHLLEERNSRIHLLVGDESFGVGVECQNLTIEFCLNLCSTQHREAINCGEHHRKCRLGADSEFGSGYIHIETTLDTQCGESKWVCDWNKNLSCGTCSFFVN